MSEDELWGSVGREIKERQKDVQKDGSKELVADILKGKVKSGDLKNPAFLKSYGMKLGEEEESTPIQREIVNAILEGTVNKDNVQEVMKSVTNVLDIVKSASGSEEKKLIKGILAGKVNANSSEIKEMEKKVVKRFG